MKAKLPIILIVENIRSSYNIGALLRTADAAGIEEVIFSSLCPIPPRTDILKTALGAEKTVTWRQSLSLEQELITLQDRGYMVVALEQTEQATSLFTTSLSLPLVLIIGHEREGVSKSLLDLSDFHTQLPMQGSSAHSLNVCTATGIALYELGRRFWYHESI